MFCAHLLEVRFRLEYRAIWVVYAERAESRQLANYPYRAVFTFGLLALGALMFSIYLTVYTLFHDLKVKKHNMHANLCSMLRFKRNGGIPSVCKLPLRGGFHICHSSTLSIKYFVLFDFIRCFNATITKTK